MQISLDRTEQSYTIRGYAQGEVRVTGIHRAEGATVTDDGDTVFTRSVLVSPRAVRPDWPPQTFDELEPEHFRQLGELAPDVVLFGSGKTMRFPSPQLLRSLVELGVGYEVMDTAAACRTYNILAAEGRSVAAALLID